MDRPCVARGFQRWRGWSCANVSGLLWSKDVLRAMMDIRARPISLADRPLSGHLGHQITDAPARPFPISCSSRRPRREFYKLVVSDVAPQASSALMRGS